LANNFSHGSVRHVAEFDEKSVGMKQSRGTYDSVRIAASSFVDNSVVYMWKFILFYQALFQEIFNLMD
jgi:hypothetical protein